MISFKKACEIIKKNIKVSKKEELIKIEEACSRIVSRDYYSKFDMPFNNLSAMDGIVVNKRSLSLNKKFFDPNKSKKNIGKFNDIHPDKYEAIKYIEDNLSEYLYVKF